MDRVESTVASLLTDDAMGLPGFSDGGAAPDARQGARWLAHAPNRGSPRLHCGPPPIPILDEAASSGETETHTSMPIIAGRWIREYGGAMPHRVAHPTHARSSKQIACPHMTIEASHVRGHHRIARPRLADHIVDMVKANPNKTELRFRQMDNLDYTTDHTCGDYRRASHKQNRWCIEHADHIVNDRITYRNEGLRV